MDPTALATDNNQIGAIFILVALAIAAYLISRKKLRYLGVDKAISGIILGLTFFGLSHLDFARFSDFNIANNTIQPNFDYYIKMAPLAINTSALILFVISLSVLIHHSLPRLFRRIQYLQNLTNTNHALQKKQRLNDDQYTEEIRRLKKIIKESLNNPHNVENSGSLDADLYRTIFDKSPAFFIALSEGNEIDDINSSACTRLGYSFAELVSSSLLNIVQPEERRTVAHLLKGIKNCEGDLPSFETELRDRDRKPITVTVTPHVITRKKTKTTYLFMEDISRSRALSESLAYQASHDDLTDLFNRRALEAFFSEALTELTSNTQIALIYFDVDQLKVVNDTCGHGAGDQLIKQIVAILNNITEDNVDIFARIGGDEFALVKTKCNKDSALQLAEVLRNAVEDFTFTWEGKPFRQSISVGVALSSVGRSNLKELLSAADAACYTAKENGRNQVRMHEIDDINAILEHRQGMLWVSRLDKAIRNGEFSLNFQPIVQIDLPHLPYIHYEVLLRYVDDYGNNIPPGNFLPSAERFGKSTEIDLWVLTETFDFLRRNPQHTHKLSCCSINLTSHSIANFRSRSAIIALVKAHNFPPSKICFEITETSAISNLPEAIEFIQTLRALGCHFALDDFGTGFSSFSYLKNLEVDYLKIDGSFVRDIVDDKIDKAMVRSINEIAKEMGIKTVAEYVENEAILRELKSMGVDLGQGYGIAKPMPLESIHDFYHLDQYTISG